MSENGRIDIEERLVKSTKEIAIILKSLGHPLRLEIVKSLWNEEKTFIDLRTVTGLSKTALVHHIGVLVDNGIVSRLERGLYELTKDGREIVTACVTGYAQSQIRRERESTQRAAYIQIAHTKRQDQTKDLDVEIRKLEAMKVVSVCVISRTPENDAWAKMEAWAKPLGLLNDPINHPVFGFNNPNPQPGKSEYGYEFWIRIYEDVEIDEGMEIKEVEEGLYACITCNLTEELESTFFKEKGVLESWYKLTQWVETSKYKKGGNRCLERAHEPGSSEGDFFLDLYLEIKE
ncbi:MAG: GyrI-like domain-containing protein [Candidatus Hodarchaeota archaeon]